MLSQRVFQLREGRVVNPTDQPAWKFQRGTSSEDGGQTRVATTGHFRHFTLAAQFSFLGRDEGGKPPHSENTERADESRTMDITIEELHISSSVVYVVLSN